MYWNSNPKPERKVKIPYVLKRTALKQKPRKETGELEFMRSEFEKRGGVCEITDALLEFSHFCCHHILPKSHYKKWRLLAKNLIIIDPEIHYLFHNASKEYLLSIFPKAIVLYERKESLKIEYFALPK